MRRVFADTLCWVAITHRKDQWHHAAVTMSRRLAGCQFVTTDEVLTEVLAAFCEAGPRLRQQASAMIRNLHRKATVTVHPQSRLSFLSGLALYEARPDKGYSLTDCVSMEAMRADGISEVLTHDNHFTQEGFHRLALSRCRCDQQAVLKAWSLRAILKKWPPIAAKKK